jgi:hypothetical protein
MLERIARIIGTDGDVAAGAVVRIAFCHYMIGGSPDRFLVELRHAAGLEPSRRRGSTATAL